MLRLLFFVFVVVSVSACSNSTKRRNTAYATSNPAMPFRFKPSLPTTSEGKLPTAPASLANQLSTNTTATATANTAALVTTANSSATSVAVNPSHGQPGHRCDIAVGAPLNSAPVNTANTNSLTSLPVTPTKTIASTTKTAATGVNPAHGQPGHRCDISVGAPLNSAPATVSTASNNTIVTPVTNQATTAATPVSPASQVNPADKNVKLNPPHGQPGHDCSVVVGQPLKK